MKNAAPSIDELRRLFLPEMTRNRQDIEDELRKLLAESEPWELLILRDLPADSGLSRAQVDDWKPSLLKAIRQLEPDGFYLFEQKHLPPAQTPLAILLSEMERQGYISQERGKTQHCVFHPTEAGLNWLKAQDV